MKFDLKYPLQDKVDEGGAGGTNDGVGAKTDKKPSDSPNEGWQKDDKLDASGNPLDTDAAKIAADKPAVDKATADKAEADKLVAVKATKDKPEAIDLSSPIVTQVEKLVVEAGLNAQDVAKVVTDNDGQATPEIAAALVKKHGEAVAAIILGQLSGFHTANKAKATQRDEAIYSQVAEAFAGTTEQKGSETWGELAGWAKEYVPNDERVEINKLLAQGGLAARYAVDDLINRFKSAESFTQDAQLISGDATTNDIGLKPIGKKEYVDALRKLESEGHVYGQSQEMAQLDRRRTAGIQRNI